MIIYRCTLLTIVFYTSFAWSKVDYVRVMFNSNGDELATIGWHQQSGDSVKLYWGTEDLDVADYRDYKHQSDVDAKKPYKELNNYFVRLEGLQPNTAYYFVIVDSEGCSERYWFKTTPKGENTKLSLVAGGDSRSRRDVRQKGFMMVGKLVPHAILFDGDYTDIDNPQKWKWWFEDYELTYSEFDNRIIPIITTRGNHEQSNDCLTEFFDCPSKKNTYNVTLGGDLINVICLNTEIFFGFHQKRFLEKILIQYRDFAWQIPLYHRACRPHVNWKMKMRATRAIYRKWIELFEKYGVRLAIECDSHITKTTWPIRKCKRCEGEEDGFVRDDENGIVYAGEGCWGAPLRTPDRIRNWTRDAGKINSFKWLFVDASKIELRTVDYMNVAEVEQLSERNRFEMPENIQLWQPSNGEVVILEK
ncbi:MAG: fibronectin type III domain-containing protein [Crocinitomicaceae bacterium]